MFSDFIVLPDNTLIIMKPFTLSIALACSLFINVSAMAQEVSKTDPKLQIQQAFANLAPDKREEFMLGLAKINQLVKQKRHIDALEKSFELDKIFPDHPSLLSSRAALYVQIRSFEKALTIYKKILSIIPNDPGSNFNVAEINFVTKNWQQAHNGFEKIVQSDTTSLNQYGDIAAFKLFICKVKLGDIDGAEKLASTYTKWDDSPMYYYAKSVLKSAANEKKAAKKILQDCAYVWGNVPAIALWQDTMIESGYIKSHFNIIDSEKNEPSELSP